MTKCYACEYKEYSQGNQTPSISCPSDCIILQLLQGLGVSLRGIKSLAFMMNQQFADLNELLINLDEIEKTGNLRLTPERCAYQRIYDWHKQNSDMIYQIRKEKDRYSEDYLRLVDLLPEPSQTTEEDILFIAHQVLTMLMEWAYHQKDKYGKELHEYAKIIRENLDNKGIDIKTSKLNEVLKEKQ